MRLDSDRAERRAGPVRQPKISSAIVLLPFLALQLPFLVLPHAFPLFPPPFLIVSPCVHNLSGGGDVLQDSCTSRKGGAFPGSVTAPFLLAFQMPFVVVSDHFTEVTSCKTAAPQGKAGRFLALKEQQHLSLHETAAPQRKAGFLALNRLSCVGAFLLKVLHEAPGRALRERA